MIDGWIETKGALYLFYDQMRPQTFVATWRPLLDLRTHLGWVQFADPFAEDVHAQAHEWCRNRCRGRINRTPLRDEQAIGVLGRVINGIACFDTPLLDIDEIEVGSGWISKIGEDKRRGERAESAQRRVLAELDRLVPVYLFREGELPSRLAV